MFLGGRCFLFPLSKRTEEQVFSYSGSISILLMGKKLSIFTRLLIGKKKYSPKKLMKAFVSEGQQVSKQSLRAAFDFSQSAVRTPASAISIKQSCLAF